MPIRHKNIRLDPARYIGQSSYFVTLCCASRRPVFARPDLALWLIEHLREQSVAYRFAIHAYCVMPDHVHALGTGLDLRSNLLSFLRNLKQTTGHEYLNRFRRTLWQKKFHDHILRPRDSAARIAGYIWMNPVRKGICADPRDFPYSGSFTLDWKKATSSMESWTPDWKAKAPA
jgi:putative transposase